MKILIDWIRIAHCRVFRYKNYEIYEIILMLIKFRWSFRHSENSLSFFFFFVLNIVARTFAVEKKLGVQF